MGVAKRLLVAGAQRSSAGRRADELRTGGKNDVANRCLSSFAHVARDQVSFHFDRLSSDRNFFSEYTHRYIPHPSQSYSETKRQAISRAYSTALDRTNAINKDMNYRSNSTSSRRQPTTRDVKEIDYLQTFRRDVNIPRTYYYLGKVPDHVDDQMREKFPFLPAPLHSLDGIRQSTIESLPPPRSSTTATGSVAV